ncbi:hypothetical protein TRICI_003923 [Trichomonascus ciferrii]|uniref:Uncharacterized protein n=1 Tax=Trichomonascus ciferrii TaxID=44093 RepID=A0A642V2I4_9ASCO|nr:hypothetical protein TRICI_003923 [Trichomonascus ciferrii]
MSGNNSNVALSATNQLEKLDSIDADIRFMALSDLNALLTDKADSSKQQPDIDKQIVSQISKAAVQKLDDPVSDVQSQAVKL